jgi:hypothetical protein
MNRTFARAYIAAWMMLVCTMPLRLAMKRTCTKHGAHSDWGERKPHGHHKQAYWRCRLCDRDAYEKAKGQPWHIEARHRTQAKAKIRLFAKYAYHMRAVHASLLEQYGPDVARRYEEAVASNNGRHVNTKHFLRKVVLDLHPSFTPKHVWDRVLLLNKILHRSPTNVGWSCQMCFIENCDPGFFDIDHVVSSSALGKRTRRDKLNLQVLCPNCHKCKTLGIAQWFEVERVA